MGTGKDLRDLQGFGRYLEERILPLAPVIEPVPFRGRRGEGEALPFFEDMDTHLRSQPGAVWSILGPPGTGKTYFARWAAARWAKLFLENPDGNPAPFWMDPKKLASLSAKSEAPPWQILLSAIAGELKEAPEDLSKVLAAHPVIIVIDKDEDPFLVELQLSSWIESVAPFRVLYLALHEGLEGPTVTLDPWDRETAMLAAHRQSGAQGIQWIDKVAASPASDLLSYPLFVVRLLKRKEVSVEKLVADGGVVEFLKELYSSCPPEKVDYPDWCENMLMEPGKRVPARVAARRLHLSGPAANIAWGRIFRAFLLGEVLRSGCGGLALQSRILDDDDLSLLERVLPTTSVRRSLRFLLGPHPVLATNVANIHWRLFHTPVPEESLRFASSGLRLPGYAFPKKLDKQHFFDADLTGSSFARGKLSGCSFRNASLNQANFSDAVVLKCTFTASSCSLTDFSSAAFEGCSFDGMDLTKAILHHAKFSSCRFRSTTFGLTGEGEEIVFKDCFLSHCDATRLARGGFAWDKCRLDNITFAGLKPRQFFGKETSFKHCDFMDFEAHGARLEGAVLKDCLFSGASLREANLRGAKLERLDFQPGPSSRAGLTEETTRYHPMHGSQSGYYAQSLVEGVYGDPELVRTADLRGADLRGVTLSNTDLFRVDLRGALMDPDLRKTAKEMGAFLD